MAGGVSNRLVVGVIVLLLLQSVSADSAVELGEVVRLGEVDLGLEGAAVSPDGEIVITYGADSSIFLIEASHPQSHSKLDWEGSEVLLDADFHPGGQTAFIVGKEGVALRFTREDSAVGSAGGELYFGKTELRSVSWNADGSWAYIGGEMGWIWRARGLEGGGMEVHPIEGRGASDVNAIACLAGMNICVVSTSVDGI
ncbi:MAG: WD40 repeat domain-containing protein, partial [Candidatus Thalassarchaeaceae archaeon]|nr:WD40 repeat domain-containing protein [Candidatus Thalassarchaeaceae archaeon]